VPFFLVSEAQTLRIGTAAPAGDVALGIARSIRSRVAALPEETQLVLGVAAVIGSVIPHDLLLRVAGRPAEEIINSIDAAQHARLLAPEGEDASRFAHEVIREVVSRDLGNARRASIRRRIDEVRGQ
jgi:predicted ATPase